MREPRGWRLCARRPSAVGRGANNAEQCMKHGCSIPVLLHMCMSAPKSLRTLVAADLPRVLANPKTIRSTVLNTVALSLSAPPDAKVQMVCNSQSFVPLGLARCDILPRPRPLSVRSSTYIVVDVAAPWAQAIAALPASPPLVGALAGNLEGPASSCVCAEAAGISPVVETRERTPPLPRRLG